MQKSTTLEALNALLEFFRDRNPSWDTSQREWIKAEELKIAGAVHRTFRHIDNEQCQVTVRDGANGFCIGSLKSEDILKHIEDGRYAFEPELSTVKIESCNGGSTLYLSMNGTFDYNAWGLFEDFVYSSFHTFEISEHYVAKERIGFLIKGIDPEELYGVLHRIGFNTDGIEPNNNLVANSWDQWVNDQADKQAQLKEAQAEKLRLRQEARAQAAASTNSGSAPRKPSSLPSGPVTRRWGAGISMPTPKAAGSGSGMNAPGRIAKPRESTNNEDVVVGGLSSSVVTNPKEYLDVQVMLPSWPAEDSAQACEYASACLLKPKLKPVELERLMQSFSLMNESDYSGIVGQAMLSHHLNKPIYQLLFDEMLAARPVSSIVNDSEKVDISSLL